VKGDRASKRERGKREGSNLAINMASVSFSLLSKQMLPRELQCRYSIECVGGQKEAL
jgi:hypothetical protein